MSNSQSDIDERNDMRAIIEDYRDDIRKLRRQIESTTDEIIIEDLEAQIASIEDRIHDYEHDLR